MREVLGRCHALTLRQGGSPASRRLLSIWSLSIFSSQVIRGPLDDANRSRSLVPLLKSALLYLAERECRAAQRLPAERQLFLDGLDSVGRDDSGYTPDARGLHSEAKN